MASRHLLLSIFLCTAIFEVARRVAILGHFERRALASRVSVSLSHHSSCTDRHIALLSEHIRSDHEQFALRPWSTPGQEDDSVTPSIPFAGLDDDLIQTSYRGKRIFFWGDSTMQHLSYWLHILMKMGRNSTVYHARTLSDANGIVLSEGGDCKLKAPKNKGILVCSDDRVKDRQNMTSNFDDGTSRRFIINQDRCGDFQGVHNEMKAHKPDVVIANAGLWWLHFQGQGRDARGKNPEGCVAKEWIAYEQWLQETLAAAEASGAKALLFKTTNMICEEKYSGAFQRANGMYRTKDNATISRCFHDIKALMRNNVSTDEDVLNYCENGTFNNHGSAHLNRRLLKFVEANRHNASLEVRIFDDNAIQSCNYTKVSDGRHFHPLNLARIRLLGNLLGCIH